MCESKQVWRYHVDDLGEGDLQGHIDDVVRVLHRSQGAGVVGEEVAHKLLGITSVSSQTDCKNMFLQVRVNV